MQVFTVTGLFAGQHNTKLHGTITGVIYGGLPAFRCYSKMLVDT